MKRELSAKDKAFEKERAKYRQEIRRLESELFQEKIKTLQQSDQIAELERKIESVEEDRKELLENLNMDYDEFQKMRENQETLANAAKSVQMLFGVSGMGRTSIFHNLL